MKYIITRAICKFSDGSRRTIKYNEDFITEENSTCDIDMFRQQLKAKLDKSLNILGITVISIALTYAERDGRQ